MKCPYNDFKDCIVEKCPSCNYEIIKQRVTHGKCPRCMSIDEAFQNGFIWDEVKTEYKFISCKLIESNIQPVPSNKQVINNNTKTSVLVRKSIF